LKAAVVRACFYDPDSHDVYLEFAAHWGFTSLPTQPRTASRASREQGSENTDAAYRGRLSNVPQWPHFSTFGDTSGPIRIGDAMPTMGGAILPQQLTGLLIKLMHEGVVPLHVDAPADLTYRRECRSTSR
jgi:hypothetical protein